LLGIGLVGVFSLRCCCDWCFAHSRAPQKGCAARSHLTVGTTASGMNVGAEIHRKNVAAVCDRRQFGAQFFAPCILKQVMEIITVTEMNA